MEYLQRLAYELCMAVVACAIQRQPLAHFTDVLPEAKGQSLAVFATARKL
jgi:hypothetical protein